MKIDLLNGDNYRGSQPHDQFDWLRENAPVYGSELPDGQKLWILTRYEDVFEVNRNYERFSSAEGVVFPNHGVEVEEDSGSTDERSGDGGEGDAADDPKPMMIMMDPPEHTKYRKLVSKDLTRGAVKAWESRIKEFSKEIIDRIIDNGECEFVSEVSGELAGYVIADLMGVPVEDGRELYGFTEVYHLPPGAIPGDVIEERTRRMQEYIQAVMLGKRAGPGNDLSSRLLFGKIDGTQMRDIDFSEQFMLMVNGGTDTARNVIAAGLLELLNNKEQLNWLLEDLDGRIASAREELLRWLSPVIYQCRTVRQDAKLGKQKIKAGEMVAMYYGAANRDATVFERPHELDLSRQDNKHLAFGGGHHICVGQWIARMEIDVMLKEILSRLHNIRLIGEPEWLGSNFIFGLNRMQIGFDQ